MTPPAELGAPTRTDKCAAETWLPEFACPECHGPLRADGPNGFVCRACVFHFERREGIFRFIVPGVAGGSRPDVDQQYRLLRRPDGFRAAGADYYRNLPSVPPDDPAAARWRVRRSSYALLRHYALRPMLRSPIRVLDLGAGCGWLSHRLALLGHHPVAGDHRDDEMDGLRACRHFDAPFATVQLDFDRLPFAPGQFDLVVFAESLHYSQDPVSTLTQASRMLAPGGMLAVMDSPVFALECDGQSSLEQQTRELAIEHGLTAIAPPGVGFLTFTMLERAAALAGISGRFYHSRTPFGDRVRRRFAALHLVRPAAALGVWVAR